MKKPTRHIAAVALLTVALSGCQAMTGRTTGRNVDDKAAGIIRERGDTKLGKINACAFQEIARAGIADIARDDAVSTSGVSAQGPSETED